MQVLSLVAVIMTYFMKIVNVASYSVFYLPVSCVVCMYVALSYPLDLDDPFSTYPEDLGIFYVTMSKIYLEMFSCIYQATFQPCLEQSI
jgi:hypothetical protein